MQLPDSNKLPVHLLSACFNDTSATYKYYWLLSIIAEVENGNSSIRKSDLFSRMISYAWFTVNYFHVSFGKQDLIQQAVGFLHKIESIPVDSTMEMVFQKLAKTKNEKSIQILWHFNKNVPHWFMSPWFPRMSRQEIYASSKNFDRECLYALYEDRVEVNPKWVDYLQSNARLLKDFCYWNLAIFLQRKNPNVPDIPNKLIKPGSRNNLNMQKTKFWNLVISELGSVKCIYSGKSLTVGNYVLDHFVPYNFVSHDLIWNLIPSDPEFNSMKSDKLPKIDKHFKPFYQIQETAIKIVSNKDPGNKYLEEYLTIFPDMSSISQLPFRDRIEPLIRIASNNGFVFLT